MRALLFTCARMSGSVFQRFSPHWRRVMYPKRLCFFQNHFWHFLIFIFISILSENIASPRNFPFTVHYYRRDSLGFGPLHTWKPKYRLNILALVLLVANLTSLEQECLWSVSDNITEKYWMITPQYQYWDRYRMPDIVLVLDQFKKTGIGQPLLPTIWTPETGWPG